MSGPSVLGDKAHDYSKNIIPMKNPREQNRNKIYNIN